MNDLKGTDHFTFVILLPDLLPTRIKRCYADAIAACDQIISLGAMAGPSLRQAYINRAAIRCVQGMVPDAVKTLKRAIQNGLDDQVIRSEAERLQKLAIAA
jgi:hypothetical protein